MFETIVHHTVQDLHNPQYVEDNAPFKMVNKGKGTYLGQGYYFWDNHFELACWWGEVHCNNKYMVCEANFEIPNSDFCDLVGSRADQMYFQECIEMLKAEVNTMGAIIDLLIALEQRPERKGIFSYKAIRAVDIYKGAFPQHLVNFNTGKDGITLLNPKFIVCLFKKDAQILKNFKIIYPDNYLD